MAQKFLYYGVAGVNGLGVFNNYNQVLRRRNQIKEVNTKGFYTFDDAKEWAEDRYLRLHVKHGTIHYMLPEIKRVNQIYK